MASVSPAKRRSPCVGERLCRCACSWVPELALSQHPWEMVVSLSHLLDLAFQSRTVVIVSHSPGFGKRDPSQGLTQAHWGRAVASSRPAVPDRRAMPSADLPHWGPWGRLLGYARALCPPLPPWGVSAGSRTCFGC